MSGDITIRFGLLELTMPATPAGYGIALLALGGLVSAYYVYVVRKRRRDDEFPPGPNGSGESVPLEPGDPDGPTPVDSRPQLPEPRGQRSRPQPNRRRRARQRQSRRERRRPPARH
ncbi:hypothetical protein [Kitasatospora cheerisanensis]|uniref:hypothetical protein n=1 Tax=Kitasatospora cheerisanensis TaxID=81942 RepID=UPI0012EDC653|nr:hypothetical protein [Kitasatospora cheerisanensis]